MIEDFHHPCECQTLDIRVGLKRYLQLVTITPVSIEYWTSKLALKRLLQEFSSKVFIIPVSVKQWTLQLALKRHFLEFSSKVFNRSYERQT